MPRILHILDHSLPLHSGYSFRTRAILRAQIAEGWEVKALTGQRHGAIGPASERIDGIDFHRTTLPRRGGLPALAEWREIADLASAIATLVDTWRPDIIHAHSPVLNALAALRIGNRLDIPVVYEIRAFWEDAAVANGTAKAGGMRYRLSRWLDTYAARRASAVAVICEGLRTDLLARGIDPGKISVSPNGVDMELFGASTPPNPKLRSELGLDGADVIGFIGSFYDYEGLDNLIAAMPAIAAANPAARLLLVGGGPREEALRAQADASPVASAIHLAGRVPHDQVEIGRAHV
jgi:PEP-CTERM/exosortase A-associated glycosyltransferase